MLPALGRVQRTLASARARSPNDSGWPAKVLAAVDYGENVDRGGLHEVDNAVWAFEEFPHLLVGYLGDMSPRVGELAQLRRPREQAVDHALGVNDVRPTYRAMAARCSVAVVDQ